MRRTIPAKTQIFCDLCGKEIKGQPKARITVKRKFIVGDNGFIPIFDDVGLDLCWDCDSDMFQYIRDCIKRRH